MRLAHGESLSIDSQGGGKESNLRMVADLMQVAFHLMDDSSAVNSTQTVRTELITELISFLSQPQSEWVKTIGGE